MEDAQISGAILLNALGSLVYLSEFHPSIFPQYLTISMVQIFEKRNQANPIDTNPRLKLQLHS